MRRFNSQRRSHGDRYGTTVVETAIVLPVFLMFVLGLIELGHAQLVKHLLRGACRQAARIGTTEGTSTADVRSRVLEVIGSVVDASAVQVFVKDASAFDESSDPPQGGADLEAMSDVELGDAVPRQLFMVRARINYEDVAIVPNIPYLGSFLDDVVLEGQAFMRHE
jgi:Flp pilus assembly protein TadG